LPEISRWTLAVIFRHAIGDALRDMPGAIGRSALDIRAQIAEAAASF